MVPPTAVTKGHLEVVFKELFRDDNGTHDAGNAGWNFTVFVPSLAEQLPLPTLPANSVSDYTGYRNSHP